MYLVWNVDPGGDGQGGEGAEDTRDEGEGGVGGKQLHAQFTDLRESHTITPPPAHPHPSPLTLPQGPTHLSSGADTVVHLTQNGNET